MSFAIHKSLAVAIAAYSNYPETSCTLNCIWGYSNIMAPTWRDIKYRYMRVNVSAYGFCALQFKLNSVVHQLMVLMSFHPFLAFHQEIYVLVSSKEAYVKISIRFQCYYLEMKPLQQIVVENEQEQYKTYDFFILIGIVAHVPSYKLISNLYFSIWFIMLTELVVN